jgi:cholesterol transport system auxiliary component
MITRRLFLAAGGVCPLLGGCGVIPKVNNPVPLYTLSAVEQFDRQLPKADWPLTRAPGVIEYFAKGAWADNAPVLLQDKLIESFEASGAIVAVGRDAVGLRPDYVLQSELRDFQAEYSGDTPTAHLRLAAKLVRMPDRRIVVTVNADKRVSAAGTSLAEIVRAFDRAAGEALQDVVVQVLTAAT